MSALRLGGGLVMGASALVACVESGQYNPSRVCFDTVTLVGVADGSDVETFGEIRAVEALIRWQDPERGLLRPDEFLPDIERHDLIATLGEWVIETPPS